MNFNILKLGFQAYIQEKLEKNGSESANIANSDISIFMYADEFKEYVSQELSFSTDISNMSINDILDMEIVNGKLMTDEEAAEAEKALEGFDSEEETGEDTLTETTTEEQPQMINGEEATDGQLVFQGIINDLMQTEEIKNAVDTDGNSEISKEEMTAFLEAIGTQDGDDTNLTLDDIFATINGIKDNTFNIETDEQSETKKPEVEQIQAPSQSQQSGNVGGGGFTPTSNNNNNNNNTNNNQNTESTDSLKGKSLEELKEMLPDREGKVDTAKTAVNEAIEAVNNNEAKEAVDEAFNNYVEFLEQIEENDKKFAEEIKAKNGEIEDSQGKIDEFEKQLADSLIQESELESTKSDAETAITSLESSKSAITSAMSSAETEEEKAALQGQLENIEAAIEAQKAKKKEAEDKLNILQNETIPELEKNKEKEQEHLTTLEGELDQLMKDAEEQYPELAEYRTAYDEAKKNFEEAKATAQANLETAYENLGTAQTELNELNSAISVAETEKVQKENKPSLSGEYDEEAGQKLVDAAYEMLSRYGSSTGYCARGVSRTMAIALGIQMGGHGYQWDSNMDQLVEQGMFKEVTGDYATSDDLANLPAGAVVCWENTSNSGGGGAQYGHVCIADGKGGEISDHYQASIYKSVGGRSDQYRVYIPIG